MDLIQQLVIIIEDNLNSALPVKKLAERSGYSERWLYSLFLKETGMSVAQYIRRRKLTLSALLLRHTSILVTDISLMYDFSSLQTFSRSFRQQFTLSPIRYRNAKAWDMQYAQPALYRTTKGTEFKLMEIVERNIPPALRNKKRIRLGMDFIHTTKEGRLVYNRNLFQSMMSIYEPTYNMSHFMISGEMVPAEDTDSEIIYTLTKIGKSTQPEKILPGGLYVSQKFKGTFEHIFEFQMYDAMGALCNNKCILKKGPMYTLFHRTDNKDIMNVQFLIPCLKTYPCQTR